MSVATVMALRQKSENVATLVPKFKRLTDKKDGAFRALTNSNSVKKVQF